jgi:proton glutamate symport protein
MLAAPLGVFGSVAYTVGKVGFQAFLPVLRLLATLYVSLAIFVVLVLLPIALLFRIRIKPFLEASATPLTLAFATASSEAALPQAIEHMQLLGVPRDIAAFVLPTGFAFNAAGSNLYQSVALMFLVQASGLQLTTSQQIVMLGTLFISSKGTAGVARASLLVVLSTASSFHLPAEAGFLLIGLDQVMDMGRTAINVLGNCLACVTIAKWEGEMKPDGPTRARNQ